MKCFIILVNLHFLHYHLKHSKKLPVCWPVYYFVKGSFVLPVVPTLPNTSENLLVTKYYYAVISQGIHATNREKVVLRS